MKIVNTKDTGESLLAKYNLKTLPIVNTVDQAIKSKLPTLNKLSKIDAEKAVALVALYIDELCIELNIGDKMSTTNINLTAIRIIQKYGYMKLSDIILILNKFLDGEIKLYGSISRRDIMGALHDHSQIRSMK